MVALSAARAAGVPPAEQTMGRGADYLAKAFRSASQQADERKAALTHALAAAGRGDFSAANRLHRSRNRLSPAALAYLTLALVEMGRDPMASEVARLLEAELQLEPGSPPASPRVFCSVKDDGNGFDPDVVDHGVGLDRSITDRIAEAGGQVEIAGNPGRGAELRFHI